jgi:hypothetical protein
MAPLRRRRTTLLALLAGLLAVAAVGLAWLTADDPDELGGTAAGNPTTITGDAAQASAGPGPATTAPGDTGAPGGPSSTHAGDATDGSGPPAPPAPACQRVLSDAEAAAALGTAVARVESRDGFLLRSCTWWSGSSRYLLVQVNRGVAASRDQFELSRLPGDRPVAGIGQAARWTPDTGLLDVLDGAARFQLGLFTAAGSPAAAEPPPRLEAAARAVAARL